MNLARFALIALLGLGSMAVSDDDRQPYPTVGGQSTLVLAVTWNGYPIPDMNTIRADITEVDAYIRENSYGTCWLEPTYAGPYTIPGSVQCGYDAAFDYARSIGIEPNDYAYRILYLPSSTGCSQSGGAQQAILYTGSPHRFEEVRHALGVAHGGRYDCGDVPFDPNGCDWYSRDGYSSGSLHMSSIYKRLIRWNDPVEVTESGIYHLTPFELPGGTPVIKVRGTYNGDFYYFYLSYRLPIGFDDNARIAADQGIMFHLSCWYPPHCKASTLLDMRPSVAYRYTLPVGATYRDPGDRATYFEVLSADQSGADVRIILDATVRVKQTTWGRIKATDWSRPRREWRRR